MVRFWNVIKKFFSHSRFEDFKAKRLNHNISSLNISKLSKKLFTVIQCIIVNAISKLFSSNKIFFQIFFFF